MFKKLKANKWTALLVALVLVTSVFIGGTIARYVTSTNSEDSARVAVWGINTGGEEMDLFDSEYLLDGSNNEYKAKSADDEKIVAPGLSGMSEFKIIEAKKAGLAPEVMYEVIISLDDSEIADEIKNHPGIEWKVDNGEWGTWEEFKTSLLSLSGDPSGMKVYAPGIMATEFANGKEHTVAWQWIMDSGYDIEDTAMGNYAAKVGDITAKLSITITARQTDVDSTGMLEGNGSVYDINNPTTLTFRSAAPLNELQSVKVGDDTLTQGSEYTTASGSTVVTLTDSYLSNLGTGSYTISIISTSMTAKANFTVANLPDPFVHNDVIPKNATYYQTLIKSNEPGFEPIKEISNYETILTHGDNFPEPQIGDAYVIGDYKYMYGYQSQTPSNICVPVSNMEGWGVAFIGEVDSNGKIDDMLDIIANKPVINLNYTFNGNNDLIIAPRLSKYTKYMEFTFQDCANLTTAPIIPESVTSLQGTFITCHNLRGEVQINAKNLDQFDGLFYGITSENGITLTGSCPYNILEEIAARANEINNNSNVSLK